MKVLSVNAGSSSLKFTLYEMPEAKELISGNFERIGLENSFYNIKLNGEKEKKETNLSNHKEAFELLVKELIDNKIVSDLDEIKGIGHRMVHGGSFFSDSVIVTPDVIKKVEEYSPLAPLHNPPAIIGVKSALEVFKDAPQALVFDTAFHQTMPEANYIYSVPYEWYTDYNVRRYGFHGTSHKYVSLRAGEVLGNKNAKMIICHIGNGASISAVKDGKCVNTSMGLTPNSGLMMGTRCGDIDLTILPYMMRQANLSIEQIDNILNKESGFLGVSGVSSDSRDIEAGINEGNQRCILAQEIFVKRITDYIAKYYVELEGCDALVFTAGIGENASHTRKQVVDKLKVLGFELDEEKNTVRGKEERITTDNSKIHAYVIPTNEELMIATDTYNLAK